MKQQENKKEREEKIQIGKTMYKLCVVEKDDVKETPYDVIKRLVQNNKERICCFGLNGGTKVC